MDWKNANFLLFEQFDLTTEAVLMLSSEDDDIIRAERSDGVRHSLVDIMKSVSEKSNRPNDPIKLREEDTNLIQIPRSDGVRHSLIDIYRSEKSCRKTDEFIDLREKRNSFTSFNFLKFRSEKKQDKAGTVKALDATCNSARKFRYSMDDLIEKKQTEGIIHEEEDNGLIQIPRR